MESFLEAVYKEVTRSLSIGENREIFVRGCKFNEPLVDCVRKLDPWLSIPDEKHRLT